MDTAALRRPRRGAALLVAVLALPLALLAPPAHAAGTGGIEVTPVPAVVDGEQVTAFHVDVPTDGSARRVPFTLRNLTKEPRSARLYSAAATRDAQGRFSVSGAGSSPYVELADERVQLPGGALEVREFTVRAQLEDTAYAAVVVEVTRGSVVTRAATVVYLDPEGELPVPLLLAAAALAAVVLVGGGVAVAARRRARTAVQEPLEPGAAPADP